MKPLDGLAALVTGGGSGIGLACALALAGDGCAVTIAGRSEERLEKAAAGTELRTIACDVTSEADVAAAVAAAAEPTGRLDIAVLAAGTGTAGVIADTPSTSGARYSPPTSTARSSPSSTPCPG